MKQMVNEINLQGYVFSIGGRDGSLYHGHTSAESKRPNTDYISGTLNIATDEDCTNIVPARFNFVTEFFSKSGKENSSWGVLNDIENNDLTVSSKGKDGAYKIRITASASSNPFVGQDGNLVDRPSIDVNFAHPSANGFNEKQRNTFKFDMVMVNYIEREVEDGDNYGQINGYVFNTFRREATPVVLVIRNQNGMNYFEGLGASTGNPIGIHVWGRIVSTTIRHEHQIESAWGEPTIEYTTTTTREWLIDGSSPETLPFGDESFITEDELIECLNNHENIVAAAKERAEQRNNNSSKSAFAAAPDLPATSTPKKTFGSSDDFAF